MSRRLPGIAAPCAPVTSACMAPARSCRPWPICAWRAVRPQTPTIPPWAGKGLCSGSRTARFARRGAPPRPRGGCRRPIPPRIEHPWEPQERHGNRAACNGVEAVLSAPGTPLRTRPSRRAAAGPFEADRCCCNHLYFKRFFPPRPVSTGRSHGYNGRSNFRRASWTTKTSTIPAKSRS